MKKKVSEALADNLVGAMGSAYDFAKDVNNPLDNVLARRKTGFSAEQQKAYDIFRKNFINDIADLIDYGIERQKFTLDTPSPIGPDLAISQKPPGSRTVSYPSDFKGSRTWTNTKDWLEAYRDELAAIANQQPDLPPPPAPQIRSQMNLPLDTPPEPGVVPQASTLGAQDYGSDWKQFDKPALQRRRQPAAPKSVTSSPQQTMPGVSEPVTFGGVKYYKVDGRWVNAKGRPADKNTSDLLNKVPLDESFPVTATVNGITYTRTNNGWYSDDYKAEGTLAEFLNKSYMSALVETINHNRLQKKYTQLLESEFGGLPTLGDYLYNSLIKKHVESNDIPPAVKLEIQNILDNLNKGVLSKNKSQVTKDLENIAFLIFKNSFNLMPRLMRKANT
jgi:hypothetical protein